VVADKGYHSGASLAALREMGVRSYVSVPQQPRRNWEGKAEQQAAVYAKQRRVQSERGKRMLRRRLWSPIWPNRAACYPSWR